MLHVLVVDYFPFTYCGATLAMIVLWPRFLHDLDLLFKA